MYSLCNNLSGVKFLCRLLSNDSDCIPDIHMIQWGREMITMPEKKTKLMLAGIAVCLLVFLAMQQIPKDTGKEDFTSHIHGNIGVTTNQQMIQSEIELRKFDIYVDIAMRFEHEFLVQVY